MSRALNLCASRRMADTSHPVLARMKGISKRFGRVQVLFDVDMTIHAGEVHILAGENGAGKSTLIKILAGVHTDFDGTIEIDGRDVRPRHPQDATNLGVAVIHQELSLVPPMSVADNLFLGSYPTRGGLLQRRAMTAAARRLLETVGLARLDVDRPVETYPIAVQQLVEIARALGRDAKIVIMDEPTSALSEVEVETLFRLIDRLRQRGCSVVYISHKMEEIERIGDRVTVLRDGRRIDSGPIEAFPVPRLIHAMVGRDVSEAHERQRPAAGDVLLRISNFSVFPQGLRARPSVQDVNLSVRAGEIVGLGGLRGSGASDLLWGTFGAFGGSTRGRVSVAGTSCQLTSPRQAIRAGIALLTNDRKATGLVPGASIIANTTLASLDALAPAGLRRPRRELDAARDTCERLDLRAASLAMEVASLSGGNQQKVALAKWLLTEPRIMLLDEPTRGVDVGVKREIYRLMDQWTADGRAIVLITSEMPELLAMSDRIVVLHRGRVTAEYDRETATGERVLAAAMGEAEAAA
jgi:ABC-type sugar transport system ATPase subunit